MLANEVCDSGVSPAQGLLIGKKYDTEMLRTGLLPEARAVDLDHRLAFTTYLMPQVDTTNFNEFAHR